LRVKRSGTKSKGPVSTGVPMCRPLGCVRLLEGCQMPSRALRVSAYGLPSTAHFCTNALCWLGPELAKRANKQQVLAHTPALH